MTVRDQATSTWRAVGVQNGRIDIAPTFQMAMADKPVGPLWGRVHIPHGVKRQKQAQIFEHLERYRHPWEIP